MSRREKQEFEFSPPDVSRVSAYLETLGEAGDGWINLLPGVELAEEDQPSASPGLFGILFGSKTPPVTMGTLMPPKLTRRQFDGVTIGLMHPTGNKAVARLSGLGVPLPTGWVVRQDHARRGLVIRTALGTPTGDVVQWTVRAGTALCREELTGRWQAIVYLP
ncbi:MAG TPA: hypothetical protein VGG38_01445 [Acidimicrobiales bacterium]